jgi:hypothetical protein
MITKATVQKLQLLLVFAAAVLVLEAKSQQDAPPNRTAAGRGVDGGSRGGTVPLLPVSQIDGLREIGNGSYSIADPRPLARAAELLQRKFGVPVSYEEELLQYSGDMIPAEDLPGNRELVTKYPQWKGPLVPRLGFLDLSIPTGESLKVIRDPSEYIMQAIDSHRQQGNVGRFKVVSLGVYGFSIVMDRVADKSGQIKMTAPVFDTLVSFPEKDRTLGETLELITRGVAGSGKPAFRVGAPGTETYLGRIHVQIGANSEPARLVLARALKIPGQPQSAWTLSSLPGGILLLTLRPVQIEATDSTSSTGLRPVYWTK